MNATTSIEYISSDLQTRETKELVMDTLGNSMQKENIKSFKIYMGICTGVILLLTVMVFAFTYLSVDAEQKVSKSVDYLQKSIIPGKKQSDLKRQFQHRATNSRIEEKANNQ